MIQRAKKLLSDSPEASGFCYWAVNSVLKLPDGQVILQKNCNQSCSSKIFFGLVHSSYSLPEWQAVKLTFFAPWWLSKIILTKYTWVWQLSCGITRLDIATDTVANATKIFSFSWRLKIHHFGDQISLWFRFKLKE